MWKSVKLHSESYNILKQATDRNNLSFALLFRYLTSYPPESLDKIIQKGKEIHGKNQSQKADSNAMAEEIARLKAENDRLRKQQKADTEEYQLSEADRNNPQFMKFVKDLENDENGNQVDGLFSNRN